MKTPISYYGGKQKLAKKIVSLIPHHNLYCEPFFGGGAVYFLKKKSNVEVVNDTNKELMNFYRVVKNDFVSLEKEIQITLHSRDLHRKAKTIYNYPDMFTELKRAWAVWTLSSQSFSSGLEAAWGYDVKNNTTSKKIDNKRKAFTTDFAIRLQNTQVECTDALRIIKSRDRKESFFYCDPPYYNSDCAHYGGYTIEHYKMLLEALSKIEGKFLLSSYPSDLLKQYKKKFAWHQIEIHQRVSVSLHRKDKVKREVLTANFPI